MQILKGIALVLAMCTVLVALMMRVTTSITTVMLMHATKQMPLVAKLTKLALMTMLRLLLQLMCIAHSDPVLVRVTKTKHSSHSGF